MICEWTGAGVTTMSSRCQSPVCLSETFDQSILIPSKSVSINFDSNMISFPFTQLCFHLHHGNPSTFDQSILIPSHPSSFHLHSILHSSASISITGIPPPGGLLSAAPKPWEQVIVVVSIGRNNHMITKIEGCNYLRGSILHSVGT